MNTPSRVALMLAALSTPLGAQTVAERALPASQRTFAHEFTNASSAVTLTSGSLIVGDASEMGLVFLDGRTGSGRVIGRTGSGPLEYRTVGQLLHLPGDTVAMYDIAQARLLIVSPAGAPVRTERWGADMMAAISRPQPFAMDKRGRVFGIQLPDGRLAILRGDRYVVERVARYKLPTTGRLLAAGDGVIYLAVKDEDDLEFVHMHRIP